jgi:hypothetical protein
MKQASVSSTDAVPIRESAQPRAGRGRTNSPAQEIGRLRVIRGGPLAQTACGLPSFTGMRHSPLARAACRKPELSLVAPRTLARCHHGCRGRNPARGIFITSHSTLDRHAACHVLPAANVIEITGYRVVTRWASAAAPATWRCWRRCAGPFRVSGPRHKSGAMTASPSFWRPTYFL